MPHGANVRHGECPTGALDLFSWYREHDNFEGWFKTAGELTRVQGKFEPEASYVESLKATRRVVPNVVSRQFTPPIRPWLTNIELFASGDPDASNVPYVGQWPADAGLFGKYGGPGHTDIYQDFHHPQLYYEQGTQAADFAYHFLLKMSKDLPPLLSELSFCSPAFGKPCGSETTGNARLRSSEGAAVTLTVSENRNRRVFVDAYVKEGAAIYPLITSGANVTLQKDESPFGTAQSDDLVGERIWNRVPIDLHSTNDSNLNILPFKSAIHLPFKGRVQGTALADGRHDLCVRVWDLDGNVSEEHCSAFTLDNDAPISVACNSPAISVDGKFEVDARDALTGVSAIDIETVDGRKTTIEQVPPTLSVTQSIGPLASGSHQVTLRDAVGNATSCVLRVERKPVRLQVTRSGQAVADTLSGLSRSGAPLPASGDFSFTAESVLGPIAQLEVLRNGAVILSKGPAAPESMTISTGLPPGQPGGLYLVRARDAAGRSVETAFTTVDSPIRAVQEESVAAFDPVSKKFNPRVTIEVESPSQLKSISLRELGGPSGQREIDWKPVSGTSARAVFGPLDPAKSYLAVAQTQSGDLLALRLAFSEASNNVFTGFDWSIPINAAGAAFDGTSLVTHPGASEQFLRLNASAANGTYTTAVQAIRSSQENAHRLLLGGALRLRDSSPGGSCINLVGQPIAVSTVPAAVGTQACQVAGPQNTLALRTGDTAGSLSAETAIATGRTEFLPGFSVLGPSGPFAIECPASEFLPLGRYVQAKYYLTNSPSAVRLCERAGDPPADVPFGWPARNWSLAVHGYALAPSARWLFLETDPNPAEAPKILVRAGVGVAVSAPGVGRFNFPNVTAPGGLTARPGRVKVPAGFAAVPDGAGTFIDSDAVFPEVDVTLNFDPALYHPSQLEKLVLLHITDEVSGAFKDITTARGPSSITGRAASFSPFVIALPTAALAVPIESARTLGGKAEASLTAGNEGLTLVAVDTTTLGAASFLAAKALEGYTLVGAAYRTEPPGAAFLGGARLLMRYSTKTISQADLDPASALIANFDFVPSRLDLPPQSSDATADAISMNLNRGNGMFGVFARPRDRTAPTTRLAVSGPAFTDEAGRLFVSTLSALGFVGTDSGTLVGLPSGYGQAYFKVDPSPSLLAGGLGAGTAGLFDAFQTSVTLAGGSRTIAYGGRDIAGNFETLRLAEVFVDTVPPAALLLVDNEPVPMESGGIVILRSSAMAFAAVDRGAPASGPGGVEYSLDGGPWLEFQEAFGGFSTGPHLLRWRAVDLVGNREQAREVPLDVRPFADSTPPLSRAAATGDRYLDAEGREFVSTRTLITLRAMDPFGREGPPSGVDVIRYSLSSASSTGSLVRYERPFNLPEGDLRMNFGAIDESGNAEVLRSSRIFVDATAPRTDVLIEGQSAFGSAGEVIISSATRVALVSVDPVSNAVSAGVAATLFLLDPGPDLCGLSPTSLPVAVSTAPQGSCANPYYVRPSTLTPGRHVVAYLPVDNVGNLGKLSTATVHVDAEPPSPITDFAATATSDGAVILSWTAPADAAAGVAGYEIRRSAEPLDEARFAQGILAPSPPPPENAGARQSLTLTGLAPGLIHHFALRSRDRVGNESRISNGAEARTPPAPDMATVAGQAAPGDGGDLGPAGLARLNAPAAVAVDRLGNVYVADTGNHRVRRIDAASGTIATVAGTGLPGFDGDGPASARRLRYPTGLALDPEGNLFILDRGNDRIRRIDRRTGEMTTWGGALEFAPTALAVDDDGAVHVGLVTRRVVVLHADGGFKTVAGNGLVATGPAVDGAPAGSQAIGVPTAIAVDRFGNVFFGTIESFGDNRSRIYQVEAPTGRIFLAAGGGTQTGEGVLALVADIGIPFSLAVEDDGALFFAEADRQRVRKVTGRAIFTAAGTGARGFGGDGGSPALALLNRPQGVAVDGAGSVYVADTDNHRIRRFGSGFVDREGPSPITDLAVAGTRATSVTLSWSAPFDVNSRVASYELRYGESGVLVQPGPSPQRPGARQVFTVAGLRPGTSYSFALRSRDASGNRSGPGAGIAATTRLDDTPPVSTLSIAGSSFPAASGLYIGGASKVTLAAVDLFVPGQTASGVDRILFAENPTTATIAGDLSGAAFQAYSAPFSRPEGSLVLGYGALDAAGNAEPLRLSAIFIDGTPPASRLDVQGSSRTVGGVLELAEGTPIAASSADPPLAGSVPVPGSGLAYALVLVDVAIADCGFLPGVPPRIDLSAPPGTCANPTLPALFALAPGTHVVTLQSADNVGNVEAVKTLALKVLAPPSAPPDIRDSKQADFVFSFGSHGTGPGQFDGVIGDVAVDAEGNIYAPDLLGGDIVKFDRNGKFLMEWPSAFAPPEQDRGPVGISISFDAQMEHIVAADPFNRKVKIFSKMGTLLHSIGPALGNGGGELTFPTGVACDAKGHLYIVDLGRGLVIKTDHAGNFIRSWSPSPGGGNIFLVEVDPAGAVLVPTGREISKFDQDGNRLLSFGAGLLTTAKGVAFDSYGNIFVPDAGGCGNNNLCIKIFTPDGQLITTFGRGGANPGQFGDLWGIGVDKRTSRIFIPDSSSFRITAYDVAVPTTDFKPPMTSIALPFPPVRDSSGLLYVSTSTPIGFSANDAAPPGVNPAGVAFTEYRLDSSPNFVIPWNRFAAPFVLGGFGGDRRIDFRSVDKNGNVEAPRTERLRVVPNNLLSAASIDGVIVTDTRGASALVPPGLATTASRLRVVLDSPVGGDSMAVALDGAPLLLPLSPSAACAPGTYYPGLGPSCVEARITPEVMALATGPHSLAWFARDPVGNEQGERRISFNVVSAPADPGAGGGFRRAGSIDSWPLGRPMISFQDAAVDAFGTVFALGADSLVYQFDTEGNFVRELSSHKFGSAIADGNPGKIGLYNPQDPRLLLVQGGRALWFLAGRDESGGVSVGEGVVSGVSDGAFAVNGDILLAVPYVGRIHRFGPVGYPSLGDFGGRGAGPGQFATGPHHVAVAGDGSIYATDTSPGRVLKFDPSGAFLAAITCSFGEPSGLAVDGFGNVYVTDRATKSLHLLNPSGAMLSEFGGAADGALALGDPAGLDIHRSTLKLIVADRAKPGLAVFTPDPPPAAVTDLSASPAGAGELFVTWTAPGEDGTRGTARSYDLRYSSSPITTPAEFEASTAVARLPVPSPAGSRETVSVRDLPAAMRLYLRVRAADAGGFRSGLSNAASTSTLHVATGGVLADGQDAAVFSARQMVSVTEVSSASAAGEVVLGRATEQGLVRVGSVFDLGPEGAVFAPPAMLTMAYSEAALAALGIVEQDVAIYHFDPVRGWELVPGQTRDPAANTVTVQFDRVASIFAVLAPARDRTPPATAVRIASGPGVSDASGGLIISTRTTLAFRAADPVGPAPEPISGVAHTEYRVAGTSETSFQRFVGEFSLPEGRQVLEFRSHDNAGNVEGLRAAAVVVDTAPPTIAIASPAAGGRYVARGAPIRIGFAVLDAYDPSPSSSAFLVRLKDRGSPSGGRPGVVAVSNGQTIAALDLDDGLWELRVSATDFVLNSTAASGGAFEVLHDVLPPRTSLVLGEPRTDGGPQEATFVTAATELALQSFDDLVALHDGIGLGVARQDLSVDGVSRGSFVSPDSSSATFRSTFTLLGAGEGLRLLSFNATDALGNAESIRVATVAVDNTAPLTFLAITGGRQFPAGDAFYASTDTVYALPAVDPSSGGVAVGLEATFLRLNQAAPATVSSTFTLSEGRRALSYWSRDRLGNLEAARSTTALVDGTPPVSAAAVGDPSFIDGAGVRYISSSTLVALSAADPALPDATAGSGLDRIEFSSEGGPFTAYASSLTFAEGRRLLHRRALDRVGNVEAAQTLALRSDATPPVTALAPSSTFYSSGGRDYAPPRFTYTLPARDPIVSEVASGVAETRYAIDAGATQSSTSAFTLAEGIRLVGFQSRDNVANLEAPRAAAVHVDATAPRTVLAVLGGRQVPGPDAGSFYASADTRYGLPALDPVVQDVASGVAFTRRQDNRGVFAAYASAFTLPEGVHRLGYQSQDNVQNLEILKSTTALVDATAPQTTLAIVGGRQYPGPDGSTFYASSDTRLELPGMDPVSNGVASGLAFTRRQDNGGAFQTFSAAFHLAEGAHAVSYQSQDNVANLEIARTTNAWIDATPPVTAFAFGAPYFKAADGTNYLTPATPVSFAALDPALPTGQAGSGVNRIEVSVDGGSFLTYTAPLKFPEGRHVIQYRSFDNVVNLEGTRMLYVQSDATPPRTSFAAVGGRQSRGPDAATFYASLDTRFNLPAFDPVVNNVASGLAFTRWQDNNGAYQTFSAAFSLTEGAHALTYESQDNVANLEVAHTTNVWVDATPPLTTFAFGTPYFKASDGTNYVMPATPLSFVAADPALPTGQPGSGVNRIEVAIDGGQFVTYTAPLTFAEGRHTVQYRSLDNVANAEAARTLAIRSDATPPLTALATVGGRQFPGPDSVSFYASLDTSYGLPAADPVSQDVASGLAFTRWQDGSGPFTAYGIPFALPEGVHRLGYQSQDNVENLEVPRSTTALVDATAPRTTLAYVGGRQYPGPDVNTFYASSDTRLALPAADPVSNGVASGLALTRRQDGSGTYQAYGTPFGLAEGAHRVSYQSQDNVANLEVARTTNAWIDATPPVTASAFGAPFYQAPDGTNYITPATPLSFAASDPALPTGQAGSGVNRIEVAVDGGPFFTYSAALRFPEGRHSVLYRALDNVSNYEGTRTLYLRSDATPPLSSLFIGQPQSQLPNILLVSSRTPFAVAALDPVVRDVASGVKDTFTRISDAAPSTAAFQAYGAAFTLGGGAPPPGGADVNKVIEFYSRDNVLNTELVRSSTVLLDSTPPELALLSPAFCDAGICRVLKGRFPVLGTARELHLRDYQLEYAPGKDAASGFVRIGSGTLSVTSGTLASWDASGLSGWQTLRLTGADLVLNVSALTLNVWVGDPAALMALGNHDTFNLPSAVAVSTGGAIYVADRNNDRIAVFSSAGALLAAFGSEDEEHDEQDPRGGAPSTGTLRLHKPSGVAVDGAGNIYVADTGHDRVLKLAPTGALVWAAGRIKAEEKGEAETQSGKGPGEFDKPLGVAVDAAGRVYVSDSGNHRVQTLAPDGTYLAQFALPPVEDDDEREDDGPELKLGKPAGLALDAAGNVYVADPKGRRALKFGPAGGLLLTIPIAGREKDESGRRGAAPWRPEGVAVSPSGECILVSDQKGGVILKFDRTGARNLAFGSKGEDDDDDHGLLDFNKPSGLALDAAGNLYVADRNGGRIVKLGLPDGRAALVVPPPKADDHVARGVVDHEGGGRVARKDGAAVLIPPKALPEDLRVTVASRPREAEARHGAAQGLTPASPAVEYGPEGTRFAQPVTLVIPYTPALAAATQDLKVAYWNEKKREWEPLPSTVDPAKGTVSAQTTHFSLYQVMAATRSAAAPAAAGPDAGFQFRSVYVFPNPAVGGQRPVLHVAVGVADRVTFRIYDISGQLVHEAMVEGAPQVVDDGGGPQYAYEHTWDGHIPSGVYLYVVVAEKNGQGAIRKTGKLAVVR